MHNIYLRQYNNSSTLKFQQQNYMYMRARKCCLLANNTAIDIRNGNMKAKPEIPPEIRQLGWKF